MGFRGFRVLRFTAFHGFCGLKIRCSYAHDEDLC